MAEGRQLPSGQAMIVAGEGTCAGHSFHFMGMMDGVEHRAEQESQGVTRGRMTKR